MPRLNEALPKYRKHKASGQAIVTLNGRGFYLGPYGTRTSRSEYDRLIAEWLASGRHVLADQAEVTIVELLAAFMEHAKGYYRHADGSPTTELHNYSEIVGILKGLYGRTPAAEFGPLCLQAVIGEMIRKGWVRTRINREIGRFKHIFKWAASQELVPGGVHHALSAVSGLRRGRTEAAESEPVKPVDDMHVRATLPHLSRQVRTMVELQLITGMRPGEVTSMRPADIDVSAPVWKYRPAQHKTAHHGHDRTILLGPKAQALLRPFMLRPAERFLFSPAEAVKEKLAEKHARRKTPLGYGNSPGTNRVSVRERPPGERYDNAAYRHAVVRACDLADRWAKGGKVVGNAERLVPHWHPHQLRHSAATNLRREFGLEAAQVILGQWTLSVTQLYAEKNVSAAEAIMAKVG